MRFRGLLALLVVMLLAFGSVCPGDKERFDHRRRQGTPRRAVLPGFTVEARQPSVSCQHGRDGRDRDVPIPGPASRRVNEGDGDAPGFNPSKSSAVSALGPDADVEPGAHRRRNLRNRAGDGE